jgi:hypothetical protein
MLNFIVKFGLFCVTRSGEGGLMRNFILISIVLMLFSLAPVRGIASTEVTVTLLNGSGSLISGIKRYPLAAGYKPAAGDILELNKNSMAQIEFSGGSVVALNGESRAMFFPQENGNIELFLLRGMIKAASAKGEEPLKIDAPLFGMELAGATAVGIVSPSEAQVFAEVGEVKLSQEGSTVKTIRGGQYCAFKSNLGNTEVSRLPQSFVEALPAEFKDALPDLLPGFKDRHVPLAEPREFSYSEVEEWLNSVPSVRSLLVVFWKSKVKDRRFRRSLILGLKKHPEWREVLFPPKHPQHKVKGRTQSSLQFKSLMIQGKRGSHETDRKI